MERTPSHLKIAESLRVRIKTGILKTGDRLPTFEQIHRQSGAGPNTISRAYAQLECEGLVERRKRSGVYVARARTSASHKRFVAYGAQTNYNEIDYNEIAPNYSEYWTRFYQGIEAASSKYEIDIDFSRRRNKVNWEDFSGVIDLSNHNCEATTYIPLGFPIVSAINPAPHTDSVCMNEFEAGLIATRHLIGLGHRRVGFMYLVGQPQAELRSAGYRVALLSADIVPDDRLMFGMEWRLFWPPAIREFGRHQLDAWFQEGFRRLKCTAIIVQNDWIASSVIKCLQDRGYRIPEDVSIVGFDKEPWGAGLNPPLTSAGCDMFEIGYKSVCTLMERIAAPNNPIRTTLIPASLVSRASTAPAQHD